MPATITPFPTPTRPQNPVIEAGLAELFQLGLTVARVAARLAEVEHASLHALADAATAAAQALAIPPASLADALSTGRHVDVIDAARDASITQSFDKAARAVRRTAALQARLADGRPFREPPGAPPPPTASHGKPSREKPANDAVPPERPDAPEDRAEDGNELGSMTDQQAPEAIRQDLAQAVARLSQPPAAAPAESPPPGNLRNPAQTPRPGTVTPTRPPPTPAPDT